MYTYVSEQMRLFELLQYVKIMYNKEIVLEIEGEEITIGKAFSKLNCVYEKCELVETEDAVFLTLSGEN